jgi:tRNA(Ile)-lysidine synthetase-like protein
MNTRGGGGDGIGTITATPKQATNSSCIALLCVAGAAAAAVSLHLWRGGFRRHSYSYYYSWRRRRRKSAEEQQLLARDGLVPLSISDHVRDIDEVLLYWFGQYPPEAAQKRLWMIPVQQGDRRRRVDEEIADRFTATLLALVEQDRWRVWCGTGTSSLLYGHRGKMAAIVVLDQFARHMHRYYNNCCYGADNHSNNNDSSSISSTAAATTRKPPPILPPQKALDELACEIADMLQREHGQEIQAGMLPVQYQVFALLPFRHRNVLSAVQRSQDRTEELAALQRQNEAMISGFRKATNRRLAVLQGHENAARGGGDIATSSSEYSDDDILECGPFEADLTKASQHVVYQTIYAFLQHHDIVSSSTRTNGSCIRRLVLISLSGGVDSMVIAAVLSHIQQQQLHQSSTTTLQPVAVHIDYGNRPESGAEADFVRRYCETVLHIPCHVRRIDEVTRGVTARDDYEKIAREIRYNFYRDTIRQCASSHDEDAAVGVMLGHHRGDLRENVLSNAHKGCGPLDLSGMTATSKNDGVVLFRPLLPLEKTAIFEYAHAFGVPYFKDTTPHWSTRGKLRTKLLPLLQEIYGEGSMNNLSKLAVESDECRALLHQVMIQPFLNEISYCTMGIHFPTARWRDQGCFFWKFVLRAALHSAGLGMFSDKSVVSFMERVCTPNKIRNGWLQCRRDYAVYLEKDGHIYIFYPQSFPWNTRNKSMSHACDGQSVPYGAENGVQVGPWMVSAELIDIVDEAEADSHLKEKAVQSIEAFMTGNVVYYVKVTQTSAGQVFPLEFTTFNKHSRPFAWKNIDAKIEQHLPLLGTSPHSTTDCERQQESKVMLAKVTLRSENAGLG